jgi:hypothetical protein
MLKKEHVTFLETTVRNGNAASPFVVALRAALDVLAKKRNAEFRVEDYEAITQVLADEPHDEARNEMLESLLDEIGKPSSPITSSSEPLARMQIDGLLATLNERDEKHAAEIAQLDAKHAAEIDSLHAKFDALMKQLGGPEQKPEEKKPEEKKAG